MLIHRQLTPAIIQRSYRQLIPFSIFEFQNVAQGIYRLYRLYKALLPRIPMTKPRGAKSCHALDHGTNMFP